MKRFDLSGKVALVTGGNGGIGAGIARGLLECGAAVVIAARNAEKNAATVADLSVLRPPVSAFAMDVTDEAQCKEVVRETIRRHGRIDILVNNAGIGSSKRPDEMTLAQWNAVIITNLTSVFMLSHAVYPEMKKAGGGKIINIASIAEYLATPGSTALGSSKAGIIQLARSCASAWAKDNIQVNAILPGVIETAITQAMLGNAAQRERILARTPAGRVGRPDDLAGVAVFLALLRSLLAIG
jgi:2-deoxy-D-gluconate 3-dehydrogenase